MPFLDEQGQPVTLSPEEEAQYWASQQQPPAKQQGALVDENGKSVDPFKDLTAEDLADLTRKSPDQFDLLAQFQARPELQKDTAMVDKVANAFDQLSNDHFWQGVTVKGAVKNVWNTVKGLGHAASNATGGTLLLLNSLGKTDQQEAEDDQSAGRQALANFWSAAEGSMTGLVNTAAKIAKQNLGMWKPADERTQEDRVKNLFDALAVHQVAGELASGKGAISQAITGGVAEQQPQPEEVAQVTDPFSWWALGKAIPMAGKVIPAGARAAIAETAAKAGEKLAAGAQPIIAAPAALAEKAAAGLEKYGPEASRVVAPPLLWLAGHPHAALATAFGHGYTAIAVRDLAKLSGRAAGYTKNFAQQVAGTAPMKSAYAQLFRDAAQTAPTAALELGKGAAFDAAQAMAGETPQEREAAVGLGVAFGALGGASLMGRHVLSGQIIAPRDFDFNNPIAPNGSYPELNAIHNAQFGNLTPGQRVRANAVRAFLRDANPKTDLFVTGDAPEADVASALEKAGVSPELARKAAGERGASLQFPDGKSLLVVKEPTSAPHEAFHSLEDVLGEDTMRNLDEAVKQQYASQWQDFGERYASALSGKRITGPLWRDTILNNSQWGRTAAIEKLWRQAMLDYSAEAQRTGQSMPTEAEVKNRVTQEFDANGQNWNQILTPEEQQAVADRYVAREKLAENFDAWFKHAGPTLEPGKQIPEQISRLIGTWMSVLGGEPLRGRTTTLGVTPSIPIIEQIREGVKPLQPVPVVAKAGAAKPVAAPRIPLGAPQAGTEARDVAQKAPDAPVEGATLTQKDISNRLADAVEKGQGVRLMYRSAPGEPAAAPAQSRETRRAVVEYARTMPEDQKPLWQKLFFPWRASLQKNGETTWGGWVPEVLAANANRVAQWAAETGNEARLPFAVDTANKTFTTAGWTQLFQRTQSFVQNQLAGRTGAGQPLVVPESVRRAGGYAPELGPAAEIPISQREADFISLLFGTGQLPKTARISTKTLGVPLSIAGEEVSAATLPGRVQPPVVPRGEFKGPKAEQLGIAGREVMEVNPLRAELEQAGNFPKMLEAYQNLNLRNILHAEPAPEQPRFGANVLTLTAGFMPKQEIQIEGPDGKKYRATFDGIQDFSSIGRGRVAQITPLENLPGGPVAKSTTYGPSLEAKGFKLPAGLTEEPGLTAEQVQFFPGGDPRAIRAAAIRDPDTGEMVEGPMHFFARQQYSQTHPGFDPMNFFRMQEGFVDNAGNFLTRTQAFDRAKEMNQLKAAETPGQREMQEKFDAFKQLSSERVQFIPSEFSLKPGETGENAEDVGFGNFWLSPQGKFFRVGDHGQWALERTVFPDEKALQTEVRTLFGPGPSNRGRVGRVAEEALKARGWARISREREGSGSAVFADVARLTPQQENAIGIWRKENPDVEFIPRSQFQPKTFIVRHGSTEMNNEDPAKDLIRGHINVPLDAKGRREAEQTGKEIAAQGGVEHIVSSDLDRTMDTANAIARHNPGATIEAEPGLRPWNFGPTIEGKPTKEMLPKIRELTENPDQRPPGGETFNEFKDRFLDAFHRAQAANVDKNTALVTHYRGTKLLDAWRATGVDNDGIDKAVFEAYDKNKKPGNVDVVDKTGAEVAQFMAKPKTTALTHYTTAEDLEKLDPTMHGTGLAGAELARKRDYPELYVPRSYFGTRGYEKEPGLGNVRYKAEVRSGNLYDFSEDPKGLYPSSKELEEAGYAPMDQRAAVSMYEKRIQDAGYEGYINKDLKAVAKFTETPVKKMATKAQYTPGNKKDDINEIPRAKQFWILNSGKVIPAPEGHLDATRDFLSEDLFTDENVEQMTPIYDAMKARGHVRGFYGRDGIETESDGPLSRSARETLEDVSHQLKIPIEHNGKVFETGFTGESAQFMTAPEPEEFKDQRTLPAALAKPNWAIITATQEKRGPANAEVNQIANDNLEKALIAEGYNPQTVSGSYKGVDQGKSFLVTGMSPEEARKWAKQYEQESVLTPDGLLYQNGEVHPIEPTEHFFGDEAKKQDAWSQVEGGPAFSMGIDFSQKMPLAEARKAFEVRGPVPVAHESLKVARGRQRAPEEAQTLSLQHVLDNPDMEGFAKKAVEKIKTIPGFKNISAKSIPKALNEMVDRMKQNIRFLYDKATPGNRELWRQWYDLANKMTKEWGSEYGFHPDIVAAINARLSPQTDWYNNVTLTRAVFDTFQKDPAFTEADRLFLKEKLESIESDKDRNAMLDQLSGIKNGQKMSELNDVQAGMLMRAHNETTRSLLTHDHNLKLTGDFTGWGKPFDDLRSVISILRNPSYENVDRELGNNHKVRSFYNNHVAPESADWTTIDTHAAAAATLMPYGSRDQQIKDVFGSPKHKASGYNGTYFLYQHAYEQVAKELGILPRELQSIVWEQMRGSLSPEAKRSLIADKFEPLLKVHRKIDDGKMTPAEGREAIYKIFKETGADRQGTFDIDIQPKPE